MAGILKFELDRAFKNRRMGGVLLIGLSISLWHLWEYIVPVRDYVNGGRLSSVIFQQMDGWGELLLPGFFVFYVAAHALRASPQYKFCI